METSDNRQAILTQFLSSFRPAQINDSFIEINTSEDIRGELMPVMEIDIDTIADTMLRLGYNLMYKEFKFGWAMIRLE